MQQIWVPEHYYYRRNFRQSLSVANTFVPHAATVRSSYTLGLDQAMRVEAVSLRVIRRTAAAPAADVALVARIAGIDIARAQFYGLNAVGDHAEMFFGTSIIADPTETVDLLTLDLSTGGTCDYIGALTGTVYSVL